MFGIIHVYMVSWGASTLRPLRAVPTSPKKGAKTCSAVHAGQDEQARCETHLLI